MCVCVWGGQPGCRFRPPPSPGPSQGCTFDTLHHSGSPWGVSVPSMQMQQSEELFQQEEAVLVGKWEGSTGTSQGSLLSSVRVETNEPGVRQTWIRAQCVSKREMGTCCIWVRLKGRWMGGQHQALLSAPTHEGCHSTHCLAHRNPGTSFSTHPHLPTAPPCNPDCQEQRDGKVGPPLRSLRLVSSFSRWGNGTQWCS